jgi:hypothetical protein
MWMSIGRTVAIVGVLAGIGYAVYGYMYIEYSCARGNKEACAQK